MKVTFLGTAAAEGIPALWCECPICQQAKELGGKDFRCRCSYLIDSDTMVDFGPDAFRQVADYKIDLTKLARVIFTHPHEDHLAPAEFTWRRAPWFSQVSHELTVIGAPSIFCTIIAFAATHCNAIYDLRDLRLRPVAVDPGLWLQDGDIELLPLRANHCPGQNGMIYVIRRGGRNFLLANDTGYLAESEWECLKGVRLDLVSIDCTCAFGSPDLRDNHMGVNTVLAFRDRLAELGCLTPESRVFVNHFSHNGKALHSDLEAFFLPRGIGVAFDGMCVEL